MDFDLADHLTRTSLRWHKRSVERTYNSGSGFKNNAETELSIGFRLRHHKGEVNHQTPAENASTYSAYLLSDVSTDGPVSANGLEVTVEQVSVELRFEVMFRFNATNVTLDHVANFIRDHGLDYAMGFLRAGAADQTRLVGLPALILPFNRPPWDEVEKMLFADSAEPDS